MSIYRYKYPKGLIKMTAGFVKNDPADTNPMGVSKDMYGGFKVVATKEDMLDIHPNYLLAGYTACLVCAGEEGGPELYYLEGGPSKEDGTLIGDWKKSDLGGNLTGGMLYRGKFDPSNYSLSDSGKGNSPGDLYVVETDDIVEFLDENLFGGKEVYLKNTDWVIYNGEIFEHIKQESGTFLTWKTLSGIPETVKLLEKGKLPGHSHYASEIELGEKVAGTNYTRLDELLNIIVYSNAIASSSATASSGQLLTLSQLEEKFVSNDGLAISMSEIITAELSKYWTSDKLKEELSQKQGILSDEEVKKKLLNNRDTHVLTDEEYKKLQGIGPGNRNAKIVLKAVEPQDGGIITPVLKEGLSGEEIITGFSTTGAKVRCRFRYSTMASLYGAFLVDGEPFDTAYRIGTSEIFEGVADVDVTGRKNIQVIGDDHLNIPVMQVIEMISSVLLPELSQPKTHYHKGEEITLHIIGEGIDFVEVSGGTGIEKKGKIPVMSKDGTFSMTVTVSHDGGVSQASCMLTPYRGSSPGKGYLVDKIPVDNTAPELFLEMYCSDGYSALKGNDAIIIEYLGNNFDYVWVSQYDDELLKLNGPKQELKYSALDVVGPPVDQFNLFRVGGDDVITQVHITARKDANQKETTVVLDVVIYDIVPEFLKTIQGIKSGMRNLLDVTAYPEKLVSIYNPEYQIGAINVVDKKLEISVGDEVEHDGRAYKASFDFITIAGGQGVGEMQYRIEGFAERVYELVYPAFRFQLPFRIIEPTRIKMMGVINSSPFFEIASFEHEGKGANGFIIVDGDTISLRKELESFGYKEGNSITIKIEE